MPLMQEPMVADGIRDLYERGWYTTFMYEFREPVERAQTGAQVMAYFLKHLLRQSVQSHAAEQLRARCEPILKEARERGCLFFDCSDTRTSIVMTFNNGVDRQYTRTLGHVRLWKKYGVYPDWVYLKVAVRNFFLYPDDIKPMYHGVPRHLNRLTGLRKHA